MSLIKCPECSTEVSDTASVCIKCGYALKSPKDKATNLIMPIWKTHKVIIIIIAVLAMLLTTNPSEKKHQRAVAKAMASVTAEMLDVDQLDPSRLAGVRELTKKGIERQNYLLFSLTKDIIVENKVIGFGAIGSVWLFDTSPNASSPKESGNMVVPTGVRYVHVKKPFQNIYKNIGGEIIRQTRMDERLMLLSRDNKWYKVSVDGQEGFLESSTGKVVSQ